MDLFDTAPPDEPKASFLAGFIIPLALPALAMGLGIGVSACGTLKSRAEAVQITASDAEVAACDRVGPVSLGATDGGFDQRQRDLKFETARQGANVLLVDGFAGNTSGTAYRCDGRLNAERIAS